MNILYLSELLPYFPCQDGFRLVPYNILKRLSRKHDIHLLSFINSKGELRYKETINGFCKTVQTVLFLKPTNMFGWVKSMISPYTWVEEMRELVQSTIKNNNIDIIFAEGAHVGQYVYRNKSLPKVIAPHDSSACRVSSYLSNSKSLKKRIKYLLQLLKYSNYEKKIYSKFNHCIVVGPKDKEFLKDLLPQLKVSVVNNGVDTDFFKFNPADSLEKNIIFTGNMSFLPNEDAAENFYYNIFPFIKKQIKDVRFFIVGASPSKKIYSLAKDNSVVVTGPVSDIREFVYKSSVYVCPMRLGAGIKNKILEAMAMGIPVVATSLSCAGINTNNGKEIIIENNPENFSKQVIDLLLNKGKREFLVNNARKLVELDYSWDKKVQLIERILEDELSNVEANK